MSISLGMYILTCHSYPVKYASDTATYIIYLHHLYLDLIQNEVQNKNPIGILVSYIHPNGVLRSWNLAVRAFNPSAMQICSGTAASELLVKWSEVVFSEFGMEKERDILTSCSDSGSDVKKALKKLLSLIGSGVFHISVT